MALWGHLALIVALAAMIGAVSAYGLGARSGRREVTAWGRRLTFIQFGAVVSATLILLTALMTDNFGFRYVAERSSSDLPFVYKITALYSGQEGSLLFWLLILTVYTAIVTFRWRGGDEHLIPPALAVLSGISIFFGLLVMFVASPFKTVSPPVLDGNGMNPLLQSYWMAIHPIFLYLGYVGLAVPFSFAAGALLGRSEGDRWIRITRRWTLVAWGLLSVGIMIGARWAYEELGWGGYWAWDPVENASFMPWLVGTAFIHSNMIQEKRGILKKWNVILISLAFLLTIFGTFVTRSGILSSVHAFVESNISPWFIGFLGLTAAFCAYLIIDRTDLLQDQRRVDSPASKETAFLANNWIFVATTFAILWGTVFPLVAKFFGHDATVAAPYFNKVTGPLFLVMVILMGIAPLLAWRRTTSTQFRQNFAFPLINAALLIALLIFVGVRSVPVLLALGSAFFVLNTLLEEVGKGVAVRRRSRKESFWVALFRLFNRNPRRYGGYIVHFGIVLIVVGITISQFYQYDVSQGMRLGDTARVGPYEVTFFGLEESTDGRVPAVEALLSVSRDGKIVGEYYPKKRFYPGFEREGPTTEVALRGTWDGDLYMVLAGWDEQGTTAGFKLFFNPMVNVIWLGGLFLVFGTGWSLWPRRRQLQLELNRPFAALKELRDDMAMGKISQEAYEALNAKLTRDAADLLAEEEEAVRRVKKELGLNDGEGVHAG